MIDLLKEIAAVSLAAIVWLALNVPLFWWGAYNEGSYNEWIGLGVVIFWSFGVSAWITKITYSGIMAEWTR